MPLLSRDEYHATFGQSRARVPVDDPPTFDFWAYFDTIPSADFAVHDCAAGVVENVWREGLGKFEHVLVNSEDRNVFMVLVLDLKGQVVYGHYLLDLNCEYGLWAEQSTAPDRGPQSS